MNWLFVKRRMKNELGSNWLSKFKSFEKTATKATSLGQVHKAVLKTNMQPWPANFNILIWSLLLKQI